jgi:hypothetical protein
LSDNALLICHLILTKINCIALKIRSKADFKSKSQNIWQQIILFSRRVMRVTQDLNSFGEIIAHAQCSVDEKKLKKIPCVPLKNSCKKNWFTRHVTDRFHNNHCQECVRAYLSIHDCLSFLHEVMIGIHRTKTFLHEVMIGNHRNKTTQS